MRQLPNGPICATCNLVSAETAARLTQLRLHPTGLQARKLAEIAILTELAALPKKRNKSWDGRMFNLSCTTLQMCSGADLSGHEPPQVLPKQHQLNFGTGLLQRLHPLHPQMSAAWS